MIDLISFVKTCNDKKKESKTNIIDTVVFYYSGHGEEEMEIKSDAGVSFKQMLVFPCGNKQNLSTVKSNLEEMGANHQLLLCDACRQTKNGYTPSFRLQRSLWQITIFACDSGNPAYPNGTNHARLPQEYKNYFEDKDLKHASPFTLALHHNLPKHDKFELMVADVQKHVLLMTSKMQLPVMNIGSKRLDAILTIKWRK